MTSSYTTNKNIEKPGNNDYVDTWNVPNNADWDIVDAALGGVTSLNVTAVSGTVTLSTAQYQKLILNITGTLTANVTYAIPSGVGGQWVVRNATTGAYDVIISSAGGGDSFTTAQDFVTSVISDGTNIYQISPVSIPANSITNAQLATIATQRLKGRDTAGTGDVEDITVADVMDWLGSTQGSLLYRDASAWTPLTPGTSGQFLKTQGAAANPAWATVSEVPSQTGNSRKLLTTDGSTASWSGNSTVTCAAKVTGIGAGSPVTSNSVNVASLSLTTYYILRVTFTTAMANTDYEITASTTSLACGYYVYSQTTTYFELYFYNTASGGALAPSAAHVVVHGGLG